MNAIRQPLRLIAATLLAALLPAAPAAADTILVADPTAQNLTSYARTAAWSRRAADGSYHLVVMRGGGAPADAAVTSSSVPLDPDLGPTIGTGLAVVYSRCAAGSRRRDCDVYSYNVDARVERRVARVSSRDASEIAPSQFRGVFAFARTGARGGLFIRRLGQRTRRLDAGRFDETDVSASRVIARGHTGILTFLLLAGHADRGRIVRAGRLDDNEPTVVSSPVLSRYRAYWLQRGPASDPNARSVVETTPVRGGERGPGAVDRSFAASVDAIGLGSRSVPLLYSSPAGITLIDPPLAFARARP